MITHYYAHYCSIALKDNVNGIENEYYYLLQNTYMCVLLQMIYVIFARSKSLLFHSKKEKT